MGHIPVYGWLRVDASFVKRRTVSIPSGWDDEVTDAPLKNMIEDIAERIRQNDPSHGKWCTSGHTYEVWVDASSLATGGFVGG